jgi:hypothetical protein
MARPWRTIQYALDHISYTVSPPPRLNVLKGIYRETLRITRSITIKGAGEWGPPAIDPRSPELPINNVSVIQRDSSPGVMHVISGRAIHVHISDMVFWYGGMSVQDQANISLDHVQFDSVIDRSSLTIQNSSSFFIRDSMFRTQTNVFVDLGIEIIDSIGEIHDTYIGDTFDHSVDISRFPDSPVMSVILDGLEIEGSYVSFTDGVRISGRATVSVLNTIITRPHDNPEPASFGRGTDRASAGIQVNDTGSGRALNLIVLRGNSISGFDIGIAISADGFGVLVEDNQISAISHAVQILPRYRGASFTTIDFGSGPLGSVGGNIFNPPPGGTVAFKNEETYDIWACFNNWVVPDARIDSSMIFDRLDDPAKGRVMWNTCASEAFTVATPDPASTAPLTFVTDTPEVTLIPIFSEPIVNTDTLCWQGPGSLYQVVSALKLGQVVDLLGIGENGGWLVLDNPLFPGTGCWVNEEVVDIDPNFDLASLPGIAVPPPPTLTPTPAPTLTPTPSLPATPGKPVIQNRVCNGSEYSVSIKWVDNASNENGYYVYRNGGLIATVGANATSYTDYPPYGGPYLYHIVAFNGSGQSAPSPTLQEAGCLA